MILHLRHLRKRGIIIRQQKGWAMLSHPCKYTQVCLCKGEAKPTLKNECLGFRTLSSLYTTHTHLCSSLLIISRPSQSPHRFKSPEGACTADSPHGDRLTMPHI